jgi:hypothetical protein
MFNFSPGKQTSSGINKGSAGAEAGRMTKFRSLDDIPDGFVTPGPSRPVYHGEDRGASVSDGNYFRGDAESDGN